MLQFVVGTTAIVLPKVGLPIAGVLALGQGVQQLRKRKPASTPASDPSLAAISASKPPPVLLSWSDLTCELRSKKAGNKTLLKGVSGEARPGRLLAILGPSGSGKTTLLTTLAGQMPQSKKITLTGSLTINGKPDTESNHRQAFVQQEDVFYSELTVRETLIMAAELRLPTSVTDAEKRSYVDSLMATLGLTKVANTRIGRPGKRGLSGGEKKRLSLGCELIGSPSLIFLDEPTTGLDAAAAEKVMATLKQLAANGHTVVCSIHQPRSSIWDMFDDLVLLHEGSTVYSGPANQALAYFASLGHVCPTNYNPAEFLSDLISVEYGETSNGEGRAQRLVDAWAKQPKSSSQGRQAATGTDAAVAEGLGTPPEPVVSGIQQFKLLSRRSWWQVIRDKVTTISRIGANVSSALVFGLIFYRMGRSQSAIQDRMGLMQVVAINTAMQSLSKTLNTFTKERVIVNRERAHNAYTIANYLAGKLLAELPLGAAFPALFGVLVYHVCGLNPKPVRFANFVGIVTLTSFASSAYGMMVGAFAPSTEAALAIGPAAMTLWIVFGGYYVNAKNVPRVLRWLPKASLIKQSFTALTINEMKGLTFDPDSEGRGMKDGDQVLSWLSFDNSSVRKACTQQLRIIAFYYLATYSILVAKKPKHQPVLSPRTPAAAAAEAGTAPAATAQPASGSQPAQPAAATGVPAALQ